MSLPPATFAAVGPPPDGLVLAFSSARRRRNSKAAVSAFGGAVAIASMLSFLAPPGQTLVQEPNQPAGGGVLTGLLDAPRHGAPQVRTPGTTILSLRAAASLAATTRPISAGVVRVRKQPGQIDPCTSSRTLACATLPYVVDGGPTMQARLCQVSASVTVEYDSPPVGPTRVSASRTIVVGDGCRA